MFIVAFITKVASVICELLPSGLIQSRRSLDIQLSQYFFVVAFVTKVASVICELLPSSPESL